MSVLPIFGVHNYNDTDKLCAYITVLEQLYRLNKYIKNNGILYRNVSRIINIYYFKK